MWNVEKDPWLNPNGGVAVDPRRPIDVDDFERRIAFAVSEVPRLREHVVSTLGRWSAAGVAAGPRVRPRPTTSAGSALPAPGHDARAARPRRRSSTRTLTTAPGRCGVLRHRRASRAAGPRCCGRSTTPSPTAPACGYLAEYLIQRTVDADPPPEVDLDAVLAAAVEADPGEQRTPPRAVGDRRDGGALPAPPGRHQPPADGRDGDVGRRPAAAPSTSSTTWPTTVRQARGQLITGGGEARSARGSPLWRQRSRHRHLEVLTFPLEAARAAAKGLGGSINDCSSPARSTASSPTTRPRRRRSTTVNRASWSAPAPTRRSAATRSRPTRFAGRRRHDGAAGTLRRGHATRWPRSGPRSPAQGMMSEPRRRRQPAADVAGDERGPLAGPAAGLRHAATCAAPRAERYISGALVESQYAFGPLAGTAFNLTTVSYNGQLGCGLFVDPVAVERPADLRDDMVDAYQRLLDAGGARAADGGGEQLGVCDDVVERVVLRRFAGRRGAPSVTRIPSSTGRR